jgi:hypothetical protein
MLVLVLPLPVSEPPLIFEAMKSRAARTQSFQSVVAGNAHRVPNRAGRLRCKVCKNCADSRRGAVSKTLANLAIVWRILATPLVISTTCYGQFG